MRRAVLLLGAAVFLNYVDRGAIGIAAPLMKSELGLAPKPTGSSVSAFFWVYAPVQLFAGWLCDRFSVYKLMAAGILLWAASTLADGLRRRLRFAARAADHARRRRKHRLSRQLEDHRPPRPRRTPRRGQCRRRRRDRARARGRNARRRTDPRLLGLARDLRRVRDRHLAVAASVAARRRASCRHRHRDEGRERVPIARADRQMAAVGMSIAHMRGQLLSSISCSPGCPCS